MTHRVPLRGRVPLLTVAPLLGVLLFTALPGRGVAQELTGVALGPDGAPLPNVPVVLHRVGGGGGAFVGTDTTSREGGFRFALEPGDSAIFFAALRYDGRVYIGPTVPAGGEPVSDYVLRVEPGSEAGAVANALGGSAPPAAGARPVEQTGAGDSDAGAFILIGLLAVSTVAAFLFAAPRYRHRRTRDAVIHLAATENALAGAEDLEERARLETTRDRLRKQLAPRR